MSASFGEVAEWVNAHDELLRLALERGELEGREGKALLRAMRSGVHVHLGYGSFVEYAERLFGYAARTTLDKVRTAEALESLPGLELALARGEASWSAVRELARVARPETEREWLEAARGRTVREIERLVAGREPGARPSDAASSSRERRVLRFEVAAETLATFRQAMKELGQLSGGHLDDDAALLLMARHVLDSRDAANDTGGSRSNDGRASYQLAFTICERCQRGFQEANGEVLEVDAAILDMARCDARHIGRVGTPAGVNANAEARSEAEAEAGGKAEAGARSGATAGAEGTAGARAAAETGAEQAERAERAGTHMGFDWGARAPNGRAAQTIPPALRRHVLRRDSSRCVVPGCRHAAFVDLHHIQPRAEGGRHDADNLVVVCSAHHRAVHRGRLKITGSVSSGLRVQHVEGTLYGNAPSPLAIDALGKVFGALRGLGFKEREARQALDAVTAARAREPRTPTAEELLRAALEALAPTRRG